MINDTEGNVVYWGTRSEKRAGHVSLSPFSQLILKENGILIFGEDIRHKLDEPGKEELLDEIRKGIKTIREYGRETSSSILSVEWLLMSARMILWLIEQRLVSKSEAAKWACENCKGDWRFLLPQAANLRKNPELAHLPENKRWLESLVGPSQQACDELEHVLSIYYF